MIPLLKKRSQANADAYNALVTMANRLELPTSFLDDLVKWDKKFLAEKPEGIEFFWSIGPNGTHIVQMTEGSQSSTSLEQVTNLVASRQNDAMTARQRALYTVKCITDVYPPPENHYFRWSDHTLVTSSVDDVRERLESLAKRTAACRACGNPVEPNMLWCNEHCAKTFYARTSPHQVARFRQALSA